MQLKVERLGKSSFTVECRGHLLLADQPKSKGGTDVAMTPTEIFLASVGTCVGYYLAQYCDARNLECGDLALDVSGEILSNPGRIGRIVLNVKLPVGVDDKHLQGLIRAATHCTIHNTLTRAPAVDIHVETPTLCHI